MNSENNSIELQIKELLDIANEIGLKINTNKIKDDIKNKEQLATFKIFLEAMRYLKLIHTIGKIASEKCDLEELNALPISLSISKLFEALKNNHVISEMIRKFNVSLLKFSIPSLETYHALLNIPRKIKLEERIRKLIIKYFQKANAISPRAVAKIFYDISTFYQNKPRPREVLEKASYSELLIPTSPEEIKTLNLNNLMHFLKNKKETLFKFDGDKIKDITRELIRRFGNLIEVQLKLILCAILNLKRVETSEKFVEPNNQLRYFLHQLSIERYSEDKGNYLDIRNCDAHDTIQIIVDQNKKDVQVVFVLQHFNADGSLAREEPLPPETLDKVYNKMEAFITFSRLFHNFFIAYLVDWQLKKKGKSYDEIINALNKKMDKMNLQQEIANLFRDIQEELDKK